MSNTALLATRLVELLKGFRSVAVAYSGGVDSAVVAKAAQIALGTNAVAVTAVSPSLAEGELEAAQQLAALIGIRHEIIRTEEFSQRGYQQNAGNRCYYCKTELYSQLQELGPRFQVEAVVNGTNLDDLGDHRPGLQAANEHGVRSPLAEASLHKADVRALAQHWQLPVWDKPAAPCLSSRIAYGVEVTPERVRRIDQAEAFLRQEFGLRELRVRLEANNLARIEVPLSYLAELSAPPSAAKISKKFHVLGFRAIALDLEGFRSGNLNSVLPLVTLTTGMSKDEP